jgi:hypothetical protein
MRPTVTMRRALNDPQLLGKMLGGDSWAAWCVLLIAIMGEELTPDERVIFKQLTGRDHEPGAPIEEFWGIIGRRGGKSRAMSALAIYLAGLCEHPSLVAGEKGVLLCIAPDQRQASIVFGYIVAAFEDSALLSQLITRKTADTLELSTGVSIEVRAANFRRLRGPTYIAVIGDECAFWQNDDLSNNPDSEIINAVRPGLATTGGPVIMITSPYAKRGEAYAAFRDHYGPNGDPLVIVAKGPSRTFNPTLKQSVVDRALKKDRAAASAEYLGEFRNDIESFVSLETVLACVSDGVRERAPVPGLTYNGFVDPSGGSQDSMTMAIAHKERDTFVIDAKREVRPPFDPSVVVEEFCLLLKNYRIKRVRGDRYAGEWPAEQFRKHGVTYEPSDKTKSEIYRDSLPLLNAKRIALLDDDRLVSQIASLERRTARGGRDSIDHAPGAHDDLCNAVLGATVQQSKYNGYDASLRWVTESRSSAPKNTQQSPTVSAIATLANLNTR